MWFAENGTGKIGTITTAGAITEYGVTTAGSGPVEITQAPIGLLGSNNAFTENNADKIGVMDPSGAMVNEYSVAPGSKPFGLTTDSSGSDLWFTQNCAGEIGEMTSITSGGVITEFTTATNPLSIVENVSNLNLYFTEPGGYIGVVNTPTSVPNVKEYSNGLLPGASPWGIALGSDGQMWFTDQGADAVGAFNTTTHAIVEYTAGITPGDTYPRDIASGPDGALWFTEWGANKIGRIDPATQAVTEYSIPTSNSRPYGIVEDGSYMWFTETSGNKVGKIGPIQGTVGGRRRSLAGARAHAWATVRPKPKGP